MNSQQTKTLDWNEAASLGLIVRINSEILHPLGLAMCRNVEDGTSPYLLVSGDGEWTYAVNSLPALLAQANKRLAKFYAIADERTQGYADHKHGGVLNGHCMNQVCALVQEIRASAVVTVDQ